MRKRILAFVLAITLIMSSVICAVPAAFADDGFDVTVTGWMSGLQNGCPTYWMANISTEDQVLTRQAMADEIKRLHTAVGYNTGVGGTVGIETWAPTWTAAGIMLNLDSANSDNIGKIHSNNWGFSQIGTIIYAPWPGMAFSQIRYMSQDYVARNWPALLSDTFLYNGRYHSVTWSTVKSYDASIPEERGRVLSETELTYTDLYPGSGAAGNNNTFRYAYAKYNQENKATGKVLGIPTENAEILSNGVTYQAFEGPDGDAYIAGSQSVISTAYKTPEKPEGAYVIAGEIAEAFVTLGDTGIERFAVTGAPTGDAYTEDGRICQDFELMTLAVDPDTGDMTQTSNDTSFLNFAIEGGRIIEGLDDGIVVLMPKDTDVTKLTASFDIHEKSTVTPAVGVQDFTLPVTYTVTSELGVSVDYKVTVVVDGPGSSEDRAAAQAVTALIDALPETVALADKAQVTEAKNAFDVLTPAQKYLVTNVDKLRIAVDHMNVLNKGKIKVACVGDSITEGDVGGGVNSSVAYPTQLQELLGDRYEVRNFGRCGTRASKNSDYPYWITEQFNASQSYPADIVIIMLGINDAGDGQWYKVKDNFEADYKELVGIYQNLPTKPIVYLTESSGVNCAHAAAEEMNTIVMRIAEEMGTQTADMYTWEKALSEEQIKNLFAPDRLHPNANGYTVMAQQFYQQIFVPLENSSLQGVSLNDAKLEGFDPEITDYTVKLNAGEALPVISADAANELAGVRIIQPTVQNPVARIIVTAGNPYFVTTYRVTFESEELDAAAANAVDELIAALGEIVSAGQAADIENARKAYDMLTQTQKQLVKKYDVLVAAEVALDAIINPIVKGDVDGDGKVLVADMLTLKNLIMTGKWNSEQLKAGDMNTDGKLDVNDMLSIKNVIMAG